MNAPITRHLVVEAGAPSIAITSCRAAVSFVIVSNAETRMPKRAAGIGGHLAVVKDQARRLWGEGYFVICSSRQGPPPQTQVLAKREWSLWHPPLQQRPHGFLQNAAPSLLGVVELG